MTPCPDENVIARFVRGGLTAADAHGVEVHVDRCSACATLISALAQMGASVPVAAAAGASLAGAVTVPAAGGPVTAGPVATGPMVSGLAAGAPAFGRYVVERPIGAGAMGVVYAAHDPVLGRRVALKVLRREAAGSAAGAEQADARLLREARVMASLAHPNVVPVHDAGVVGEQVYLAMELIEGQTLADWLRQPRGWREVLDRFRDAAMGLAAAHEAGILHRDFKPANVLIGADGRARVTDFGLARSAGVVAHKPYPIAGQSQALAPHAWAPHVAETTAGALVGTPAYMSPEQMLLRPLDARADQFSFCVALYEALFGAQPFGGSTLMERRYALANDRPAWPAKQRGAPWALTAAVMRGLSPAPEARFPSMRALVEAMDESRSRSGELHVRINAVCQAIGGAVHVAMLSAFIASDPLSKPLQSATPAPAGTVASSAGNTLVGMVVGAVFVGFVLFGFLTPVAVVWAPLNAIGLWRRWGWARVSAMVYGAFCILSCVGLPYGIYALWSLRRPGVREAFSRR